jgi:hypothetical protein
VSDWELAEASTIAISPLEEPLVVPLVVPLAELPPRGGYVSMLKSSSASLVLLADPLSVAFLLLSFDSEPLAPVELGSAALLPESDAAVLSIVSAPEWHSTTTEAQLTGVGVEKLAKASRFTFKYSA